ncbi:hypothetical protein CATRI_01320 [Corynebacterium atrinae]|uniref:lysoplasmalogenase family protein n=1 Tax=Corynebacterium atrinae TaxID=1336740 RepID=UPI0025B39A84|nr:lysoplasmalogenase family protein [Corynebacterium atrinae]WJY62378.1 hypothetical protein CATRI_01320 [Corynebacterium atrinae]
MSVNYMVSHTRAGVDALVASLVAATEEPERLVYLGVGKLNVISKLLGWTRADRAVTQVVMPALAGSVLRHGSSPVLLAGLAGGWVGDRAKLVPPDRTPVWGLCGIAANHAAYAVELHRRGARPSISRSGLRAAAWATGVGLASWRKKELIAPATIAGAFVCATSTLADDPALQDGSTPAKGLGHGGNLLLVAEGMALLRETLLTGDSAAHRAVDAAMRAGQIIGHLLIVDGLTRD